MTDGPFTVTVRLLAALPSELVKKIGSPTFKLNDLPSTLNNEYSLRAFPEIVLRRGWAAAIFCPWGGGILEVKCPGEGGT